MQTTPSRDDVRQRLDAAVARLIEIDVYLLQADVNERSITHRLAMYLQEEFPEWHVDCEYNRDGHELKQLALDDADPSWVYPDIIVHVRGSADNLLVIEAKKTNSSVRVDRDRQKLDAFQTQLGYQYTALLTLDQDAPWIGIEWV